MIQCPKCGFGETSAVPFCSVCGSLLAAKNSSTHSFLERWEKREGSLFGALFSLLRQILTAPSTVFSRITSRTDTGSAIFFHILILLLVIPSMLLYMLGNEQILLQLTGETSSSLSSEYGPGYALLETVLQPAFIVLSSLFSLFFWSSFYHLIFKSSGLAKEKYKSTLTAMSYARAPMILFLLPIPMVTQLAVSVWVFILEIIGLAKVHGSDKTKLFLTMFISSFALKSILFLIFVLLILLVVSVVMSAGLLTAELLPYKDLLDLIR